MQKCLILLLCLLATVPSSADTKMEQLYQQLDDAIAQWPTFVAQRQQRINQLKSKYAHTKDARQQLLLADKLFEEYRSYRSDSALFYMSQCINLAKNDLHDQQLEYFCQVKMAFLCSSTGLYTEALDYLHTVDPTLLSREQKGLYYMATAHVWGELSYYSRIDSLSKRYRQLQLENRALMYQLMNPSDDYYLQSKEMDCNDRSDLAGALRYNDQRMKAVQVGDRNYAIVAFYRYLDYKFNGKDDGLEWLCQAAISDVRHAVTDQAAMWELANHLNESGDLERSYHYVTFAWQCASTFGTRLRNWQISPVLSTVDKSYQEQTTKTNTTLKAMVVCISLLAVMLVFSLISVKRQRQKLAVANTKLEATSQQLAENVKQLSSLNQQVNAANNDLAEANRVKEEYIGRFMTLCSHNIDEMERMRHELLKEVRGNNAGRARALAADPSEKEHALAVFYEEFDHAFLHLYPDFVNRFNALLMPSMRQEMSANGTLTTPLRIFALIRLGIDDSSKIAEFLHYSVKTIYNYRARVKNGAIGDRDAFENEVKRL